MVNETIKRWSILGGLLAVTLWLVWFIPETDNDSDVVEVNATRSAKQPKNLGEGTSEHEVDDLFALKQRIPTNGKPIDIFGTHIKQVKKTVQPAIKAMIKVEPVAPRLPFSYIGKLVENDVTKVFLLEGQALHIVSQGDKVGKDYKLKHVDEQQISLLYLPLNTIQNMNIGKTP